MRFLPVLTLLFCLTLHALHAEEPAKPQAGEPPELTRLRELHEAAAKKAAIELDSTYAKELDKLLDKALGSGKSDAAAAISEELKKAAAHITGLGGPLPPLAHMESPSPLKDAVLILANTPEGFSLGPIKAGTKIELQYSFGKWKAWGRIPELNPDDPGAQEHGDASRLVIAESPKNGVPGTIIEMIPPNTKDKPFTFTFPSDHPGGVCLRIHDNSEHKSNPGEVAYKVKLGR